MPAHDQAIAPTRRPSPRPADTAEATHAFAVIATAFAVTALVAAGIAYRATHACPEPRDS